MNEYKMDVLDESEKGITGTRTPPSVEQIMAEEEREAEQELVGMDNVFGY
jgi:hypothetical protein